MIELTTVETGNITAASAECRRKSSKVSSVLNVLCTITIELTFEKCVANMTGARLKYTHSALFIIYIYRYISVYIYIYINIYTYIYI